MAGATQSPAFEQAAKDVKNLKAKPTDNELLEVSAPAAHAISFFPPNPMSRIHGACAGASTRVRSRDASPAEPPRPRADRADACASQLYGLYKQGTAESRFEDATKPGSFNFKVSMPVYLSPEIRVRTRRAAGSPPTNATCCPG